MLVYFRSNFYYSPQCFFLVDILNMVSLYIYFVIYLLSYYIIFLWRYSQLFRLFSVQFLFLSKKATFNANTLCSKPRFDDMNISLTNFILLWLNILAKRIFWWKMLSVSSMYQSDLGLAILLNLVFFKKKKLYVTVLRAWGFIL